jgi:hypothetical protein
VALTTRVRVSVRDALSASPAPDGHMGMPIIELEHLTKQFDEFVDLTDRKDSIVKHYSGGLELARGLMHQRRWGAPAP